MFTLKAQRVSLEYVAFSPDGNRLAACGLRGPLQFWSLPERKLAHKLALPAIARMIAFSPVDGDLYALIDDEGLCRFDPSTGERVGVPVFGTDAYAAAFSADGQRVCLCSTDPDASHLLRRHRLPGGEADWTADVPGALGLVALAYSATGDRVALGKPSGSVHLFDAADGSPRGRCGSDGGPGVRSVALSPDGRLVAWTATGNLHLWRLDPPAEVARHSLGRTHLFSVRFHPSGEFLATANGDGKVDLWDGRTGGHRAALDWGVGPLRDVAFDAGGDRGACCGKGGEIVVWDVDR